MKTLIERIKSIQKKTDNALDPVSYTHLQALHNELEKEFNNKRIDVLAKPNDNDASELARLAVQKDIVNTFLKAFNPNHPEETKDFYELISLKDDRLKDQPEARLEINIALALDQKERFARLLAKEKNPLALTEAFQSICSSQDTYKYIGLLTYLLDDPDKKMTIEALIESGLPSDFVSYQMEEELVQATYARLLTKMIPNQYDELINLFKTTDASISGVTFNLMGASIEPGQLKEVKYKPPQFTPTATVDNLKNLIELFGDKTWFYILKHLASVCSNETIKEFITEKLQTMKPESLASICLEINQSYPIDEDFGGQDLFYQKLCSHLSDANIKALVGQKTGATWPLLANLASINPTAFRNLLSELIHDLESTSIDHLQPKHADILKEYADLKVIIVKNAQSKVNALAKACQNLINKTPFDYIEVRDWYRGNRETMVSLTKLTGKTHLLGQDAYAFDVFCLETLMTKQNFTEAWNTLIPQSSPNYKDQEVALARYKERLLAEFLGRTENESLIQERLGYVKEMLKIESRNLIHLKCGDETLLNITLRHNNVNLFKALMSPLPIQDRLAAVQVKDNIGRTMLHLAADNPDSLKQILELLPEKDRLPAVQVKNNNGNTILLRAVANPDSLKQILALLPEKDRLSAVQVKDKCGDTVLHRTANNPDSLKNILELLPEKDRLTAVQIKDNEGNTLLHRAAKKPHSLKKILELLPAKDQLTAVQEKDKHENTVLHLAAHNPDSLKKILELLPEKDRLPAVLEKDKYGNTVLHLAANNPDSLKQILELLPEKDRLPAVQVKDKCDDTALHRAAHNPDSLKKILELLPEKDRLPAVQIKDNYGKTVLHRAAHIPDSLKQILELLPEKDRLAAVQVKDQYDMTVLHRAAHIPDSLKQILKLLPEKDRLPAVLEKDKDGFTVLFFAACDPDSLRQVLELYPESDRLPALQKKDKDGSTVLHYAADNPDSIRKTLELLPVKDRLPAVLEKDKYGNTVLHRAAHNPDSLKQILELLPEKDRLAAVQVKDKCDDTALHRAAHNPDSLRQILALLPNGEATIKVLLKNFTRDIRLIDKALADIPGALDLLKPLANIDKVHYASTALRLIKYTNKHPGTVSQDVIDLLLQQRDIWEERHADRQKTLSSYYEAIDSKSVDAIKAVCETTKDEALYNQPLLNGNTLLLDAIVNKKEEAAKYLMTMMSTEALNVVNDEGASALSQAIANDWNDLAESLLKQGANPEIGKNQEKSPLELAKIKGFTKLLNQMEQQAVSNPMTHSFFPPHSHQSDETTLKTTKKM